MLDPILIPIFADPTRVVFAALILVLVVTGGAIFWPR